MPQIINTNIASLNSQRSLNGSQNALNTALQRLSSGLRINSAKDDAAGLAISERMTSQIRGTNQAVRNANDGVSLMQTAEGALTAAGDILQRVRELAVQSANATNSAGDRKAIQAEVGQLLSELDRIAVSTEFNGQKLLDGSFGSAAFQIGANANQTITATTGNFRTSTYGAQLMESKGQAVVDTTAGTEVKPEIGTSVDILGLEKATITFGQNDSASTVAAKINAQSEKTGVSASARNVSQLSEFTSGKSFSLAITSSNTTAANIAFSVSATGDLNEAVKAINDVASQTGVTAKLVDGKITLTNESGDNIRIVNNSALAGDAFKLAGSDASVASGFGTAQTVAGAGIGATTMGSVELNSDKGFSTAVATAATSPAIDLFPGTSVASKLNSVDTIDVSSVDGSTKALKIIDSALAVVNGQRASFGALQSRFETTISNLQTTSENLSASRSRIMDADFAAETAALTRAQILQQAGVAMLAQANALPNNVLSLLR